VTLAVLEDEPIPGRYDIAHLNAFHRRIFGDIYDWAGELRSVVIAKDDSVFALPEHIEPYLSGVLAQLAGERFLRGLDRDQFLDRFTDYHAELNAAHHFREGNGRTLRAFLGQLSHEAGYHLAWERLDPGRNAQASRGQSSRREPAIRRTGIGEKRGGPTSRSARSARRRPHQL